MRTSTNWFRERKWGVCCHYLAEPPSSVFVSKVGAEEWNARVDAFDAAGFAAQMDRVGAGYVIFTVGQCSGHYCSPNRTYDGIVGRVPSLLSRRDLIADLADALAPYEIPLLAYLPSNAPEQDLLARQRFDHIPQWGEGHYWKARDATAAVRAQLGDAAVRPDIDVRLSSFQRKWEAVIREWGERWGGRVPGWWIDCCYYPDEMYKHDDPPNFASFTAALRAGNPERIVAFNYGVLGSGRTLENLAEYQDYTAGEINRWFPVCDGPDVKGAQFHVLGFLGEFWGRGEPRFPEAFVTGYTRQVTDKGGVVTWDVPIPYSGSLAESFVRQLEALGKAVPRSQQPRGRRAGDHDDD